MPDHDGALRLGPGPRPTTGSDLARRFRAVAIPALLAERPGLVVAGADAVRIEAEVEGADVSELRVDLTGVAIEQFPPPGDGDPGTGAGGFGADPDDPGADDGPAPVAGVIRSASVLARPLRILGAPITMEAHGRDVPIEWWERTEGTTDLTVGSDTGRTVHGRAEVSFPRAELDGIVRRGIEAALTHFNATVSELALNLNGGGPDIAVELSATVVARVGGVSAKFRAEARARVVHGRRVRLEAAELHSRNLLAAPLIAVVRKKIDSAVGREFDLAQLLASELGESSVRIELGAQEVTAHVTVGEP